MENSTFRHQVIILLEDSMSRIKYPIIFKWFIFKYLNILYFSSQNLVFFEKNIC
jgi:hypothetical protein